MTVSAYHGETVGFSAMGSTSCNTDAHSLLSQATYGILLLQIFTICAKIESDCSKENLYA